MSTASPFRHEFFEAWLIAWWFYLGISLGALVVLMIHHLTGGRWGRHLRAPLEAAVSALPWLALLSLPLGFGIEDLYRWAGSAAAQGELAPLIQKKIWYLNEPFFLARAVFYLAVWLILAIALRRAARTHRPVACSVLGLIGYALTVTFAAVDWIMSLEPQWYSSTFGLLTGVGQSLSGFAFGIAGVALLPRWRADVELAPPQEFQDLGNLLLTAVMLWGYLAFTQYLVVWSEDLRHENAWYLARVNTSWRWVGILLMLFQFAAPFCVLLFRQAKRRAPVMLALGVGLLVVRAIDTVWSISPSLHPDGIHFHWLAIVTFLFLGAIWLTFVRKHLAAHSPGTEYDGS